VNLTLSSLHSADPVVDLITRLKVLKEDGLLCQNGKFAKYLLSNLELMDNNIPYSFFNPSIQFQYYPPLLNLNKQIKN